MAYLASMPMPIATPSTVARRQSGAGDCQRRAAVGRSCGGDPSTVHRIHRDDEVPIRFATLAAVAPSRSEGDYEPSIDPRARVILLLTRVNHVFAGQTFEHQLVTAGVEQNAQNDVSSTVIISIAIRCRCRSA